MFLTCSSQSDSVFFGAGKYKALGIVLDHHKTIIIELLLLANAFVSIAMSDNAIVTKFG